MSTVNKKLKGFDVPIAPEALKALQASAQPHPAAAAPTEAREQPAAPAPSARAKRGPAIVATTFRLDRTLVRKVSMKLLEIGAPQGARARDRIVERALEAWLKDPKIPA